MLASELIRRLQASIDEYGDLPVLDYQEDEVSDIEHNDDEEPVFIITS